MSPSRFVFMDADGWYLTGRRLHREIYKKIASSPYE